MVPVPLRCRAIAHRDIDVPRSVYSRSRCRPDAALARSGNLVAEQRTLPVGTRSDYPPYVIAAVAVQSPIGYIHHALGQCEGSTLLVHAGIHTRRVGRAAHAYLARTCIDPHQDVRESAHLGNSKDQAGRRVIDRRSGNPKRIDVAAREIMQWNRTPDVSVP